MDPKLFKKLLYGALILGVISVVILTAVTFYLYGNVSIITYISKEVW